MTSIDGRVSPADQAMILVSDQGVLRGDGAFEVLRVYNGTPFALAEHLDRLQRSCTAIELQCPRSDIESDIGALLKTDAATDCQLRIVVTRGGRRLALLEELVQHGESVSLLPVTYAPSEVLTGVKSLSYAANMHATRIAANAGFDEALLVKPDGVVLEAPTSSIFWAVQGQLKTPSLESGILASITRQIVVDALNVEQGEFQIDDLMAADEAFLASTTREVQAVNRVADRAFQVPGPITRVAIGIVRRVVEQE